MAASSPSDVFAVGQGVEGGGFVHHYDGSSWQPSATSDPALDELSGITRVPGTDTYWAVGYGGGDTEPLYAAAEFWDGTQWQSVQTPSLGTRNGWLFSVAASGPNDAWAVGIQFTNNGKQVGLTEHWDGANWQVVADAGPQIGPGSHSFPRVQLNAITNIPGTTSYVAGGVLAPGNGRQHPNTPILEEWDGSSWTLMQNPAPLGTHDNLVTGLVALSATNIWASGVDYTRTGTYPMADHWNGVSWTSKRVPVPAGGRFGGTGAITQVPGTAELLIAGYSGPPAGMSVPLVPLIDRRS